MTTSKRVSAKELKRRRQAIGTQEAIAEALEIGVRTVMRFESGEKESERWYVLALEALGKRLGFRF